MPDILAIVAYVCSGHSYAEAGRHFGVSRQYVYQVCKDTDAEDAVQARLEDRAKIKELRRKRILANKGKPRWNHGVSAYRNGRCRCHICTEANTEWFRKYRLDKRSVIQLSQ